MLAAVATPLRSSAGRSGRRLLRRCAATKASTEWVLDVPRAEPYREKEASGSAEKQTTSAPLERGAEAAPPRQEMVRVPPIHVSALLSESQAPEIVIGDRQTYEQAKKEWRKEWSAPLAVDLSPALGGKSALAALSVDRWGELYVEDLPGSHTLKVDGAGVGKGHKVRLYEGYNFELAEGGPTFQVLKDEKAHA